MSTFSADISKWIDKANGRVDLVVRKISLDLFKRVILRSPVDTGRFRGNWQCAIGNIPDGTLELDDKAGSATLSKASAVVAGVNAGDVIYLINNLPYARRLEHGWSKQAPSGMVKITVQEYFSVVSKATNEARSEMP